MSTDSTPEAEQVPTPAFIPLDTVRSALSGRNDVQNFYFMQGILHIKVKHATDDVRDAIFRALHNHGIYNDIIFHSAIPVVDTKTVSPHDVTDMLGTLPDMKIIEQSADEPVATPDSGIKLLL